MKNLTSSIGALTLILAILSPISGVVSGGGRRGGTTPSSIYHRTYDPSHNLATRMREISQNLEIRLNQVMVNQAINYSYVNSTGLPYNASTKFEPRGMGELYNFTDFFIDLIISKQLIFKGMVTLKTPKPLDPKVKPTIEFAEPGKEWKSYVKHYGVLSGVSLACLILAAVLPCVGLIFCCCRCAGRCGARSEPFDKKHDHCRKVMLNSLLIVVATALLLGIVCAFVTNERIQDGMRDLPSNMKRSLKDVSLYLITTKAETDMLLKRNFEELEITLNNILQAAGKIVTEQLAEYSHAVSLMNLNDIVNGLIDIRNDLTTMNEITQKLRLNAQQLDNVVRGVKNNLLHTLADCPTRECKDIMQKYKVSQISVQVDFDRYLDRYFPKLPDVTAVLRNLTLLMNDNIIAEVRKGKDSFMKIQRDIQFAVNQTIPVVSASIRRAGDALTNIANNLTSVLDRADYDIDKNLIPKLNSAQRYIDEFSPYRYYVGLATCGILLSVLTCIIFGLLCGICGKRPDGYDEDCCDKGNGSRFLMMAVWMIFLITSILMILTIGHMFIGIAAKRGVCEPLKHPRNNHVFNLTEEILRVNRTLYPRNPRANITLEHIITSCHNNQTLFNVLMLENTIDLNALRSYIDRFDINKTINQLRQKINLTPGIVIFSETARQKLHDLANSGLGDIQFYKYTENLKENITNINLELLADKLEEVSNKLPTNQFEIKGSLDKNAFDLRHYHRDLVLPMIAQSEQLSESAIALQEHIRFNHSSMSEALYVLVKEVTTAQDFLNRDGPKYVQLLATKFGDAFVAQVYSFLEHVISRTRNNIGKCAPLSNAYNSTLVASCNKILNPWNGFWASVGYCLILFIPAVIFCVKLSGLYQKSDPYPGSMAETEYLYDAYADRDRNVPLSHIDKKYASHARHHSGAPYPESYEGHVPGYSDQERLPLPDPHQGSSHQDSRYSDYAPKNWDISNGGPPRYQTTTNTEAISTEYERPPPYYYPGSDERN